MKQSTVSFEGLETNFLDELCKDFGATQIMPYITLTTWENQILEASINPLISSLQSAIDAAKATRGKGAAVRYQAGTKLMNETKSTILQLKQVLPTSDIRYQMVMDKVGLEILQCGIDYYNASEEAGAAQKAMTLQSYAQSIVVGNMAKDRCKENVEILNNIIENLPPMEVFDEDKAIKEELRKYCQYPDKIEHAITLLNNTKPYLQKIKSKLGVGNSYYLKLSTQVVGNALHNIIGEVNAAQEADVNKIFGYHSDRDNTLFRILLVSKTLESAWNATKIMDAFDMEKEFKSNRYDENRRILKGLCEQLGVETGTSQPKGPTPHSSAPVTTQSHTPTTPPQTPPTTHTGNGLGGVAEGCGEELVGCIFKIIMYIAIFSIIGALISTCNN